MRSRDRVSSAAAELWGAAPDVDSELCGGGPASFRELLFYPIRDFVIGRWLELSSPAFSEPHGWLRLLLRDVWGGLGL